MTTSEPVINPSEWNYFLKDDGEQLLRSHVEDTNPPWYFVYEGNGEWHVHLDMASCYNSQIKRISPKEAQRKVDEIDKSGSSL